MANGNDKKQDEVLTVSSLMAILDSRLKAILSEMLDDKLDEKLRPLQKIDKLASDVISLKKAVENHEERIVSNEKYDRKKNLVFYGIPIEKAKPEDPMEKALEIIRGVGVDIHDRDLDAFHRLRSRSNDATPPFIIRLVNRWKKDEIFEAFKKQKPLASRWGGSVKIKVFCNEQLTPINQAILREAKNAKKYFYIWTTNGNVFCRKKLEGSQILEIKDLSTARYLETMVSEVEKAEIQIAERQRRKKWDMDNNKDGTQENEPNGVATGSQDRNSSRQHRNSASKPPTQ